jgi:hypothetical protein
LHRDIFLDNDADSGQLPLQRLSRSPGKIVALGYIGVLARDLEACARGSEVELVCEFELGDHRDNLMKRAGKQANLKSQVELGVRVQREAAGRSFHGSVRLDGFVVYMSRDTLTPRHRLKCR